jgi:hypothetical protein
VQARDKPQEKRVSLHPVRYVAIETGPSDPYLKCPGTGKLLREWGMIQRSRRENRVPPRKDIAQIIAGKLPESMPPRSLIYRRTTASRRAFAITDVRWEEDKHNGKLGEKRTLEGRN